MTEKQTAPRLSGLTREFGSVTAVNGVDLEIVEAGPSGSGKTTSVHAMVGRERCVDTAKARHADSPNAFVAPMPSVGDIVELRQREGTIRVGEVECVMNDSSGFWVAAHGADTRIYVSTADEHLEIRISRTLTSGHGRLQSHEGLNAQGIA